MSNKFKKFKELDDVEKILVLVLLYMIGRQFWILIQILWVVINNVIQMLG